MLKSLPYFLSGVVVRGFGRGSKELGCPTANFSDDVVERLPKDLDCGIYYGWAQVGNGAVHKMVMSIGYNPTYKNKKKTAETYIMHRFKEDFYGSVLRVAVMGYLRPQKCFDSKESLINAIQMDVQKAEEALNTPQSLCIADDVFFKDSNHQL